MTQLGCKQKPEDGQPFAAHLVAYGGIFDAFDPEAVGAYQTVFLGESAFQDVQADHSLLSRSLLYYDLWAKASYSDLPNYNDNPFYVLWQAAPESYGVPPYPLDYGGQHPAYLYDFRHPRGVNSLPGEQRVDIALAELEQALIDHPDIRGFFLDDFALHILNWWPLSEEVKGEIIPFYADDPGRAFAFLVSELTRFERGAALLVLKHRPKNGLIVCNGPHAFADLAPRFFENVGCVATGSGCKTTRVNLITQSHPYHLLDGDFLQLLILDSSGRMTSEGKAVWSWVAPLAKERGLSVGVAYRLDSGRPVYSAIDDPHHWPLWH